MPKREDIKSILIIGSGPIVIGQACEFDYSGTQALKALKEEGYKLILVNSNPATIMTDPEFADRTYIEPLSLEFLERIIEAERPDALLPTLGGQTALNLAVELKRAGILDKFSVELIGADVDAIEKAEDRELFKKCMEEIGLEVPKSIYVGDIESAKKFVQEVGFPVIIRPSFTLGGTGGGIAYNSEEFEELMRFALEISPVHKVLVEESVIGWKEFELEVMRDKKDNVVIVCSIENFDPMGIHTGDSITVAPQQTLTDKEYQRMRDAAIKIIRKIGVETGGSNIQFAVHPETGRMLAIEMNPRVSRSSALASKATGFPIAKIAAKLAVGYTLDEIPNDITKETPASFEPTIDYVVVKIPRFDFEKFKNVDETLTTQMKSVGEVMGIGRDFKEALMKAVRSLEKDYWGLLDQVEVVDEESFYESKLRFPNKERLFYIAEALRFGFSVERISKITRIDPWFLREIEEIVRFEMELKKMGPEKWNDEILKRAKELGISDRRIAEIEIKREEYKTKKEYKSAISKREIEIMLKRKERGIMPSFKSVDTCAGEFVAKTPYIYSTYDREDEVPPLEGKKIVILGGGPNRIGQGIEFDYCCVHACYALREAGYKAIMINCNPETVSTDYDTSDRLYFEPLTIEDVFAILTKEKPYGIILQFGGQTPLKLAVPLGKLGFRILGTQPEMIDIAEDRGRFQELVKRLKLKQPESGIAFSYEEAREVAHGLGYPVLVRPSYVLGGRAMEIVYSDEELKSYMRDAVRVSPEHPILIDKFLKDAKELDVDALSDGKDVYIGGIMEHIEEAGVHSGDSACSIPPFSLDNETIREIERQTELIARELNVIGLLNIQFAIKDGEIYILEVNPRASRTVPFVSKATGIPLAKMATFVMLGKSLEELGLKGLKRRLKWSAVKESVFPFIKFPGADTILGPEMKSTGEVMGIDRSFEIAFYKSQIAASNNLPLEGNVFISVKDEDKKKVVEIAKGFEEMGFKILATRGTAEYLRKHGVNAKMVFKVGEGRPHIVDMIKNGEISLVVNTTFGAQSIRDSFSIRRSAVSYGVPYFTTIEGAMAAVRAIKCVKNRGFEVKPLQEYYKEVKNGEETAYQGWIRKAEARA
jgi:carbamoyl-phosphate synthase large subunit